MDFFSARFKWFPVATGDHGRNLVISLWPRDKGTINGMRAYRLTPPQIMRSAKHPLENPSLDFLRSRRRPPHWLPSKGQHYQRGVLRISADVTEGHFVGKSPREVHQCGLVLARQCPGSPGTCNPEETVLSGLPISWSTTLFSQSGPVAILPVPWCHKRKWNVAIFHPTRRSLCRGDLVGRTNFWIFWVAGKSYNKGLRSVVSIVGSMLNKSQFCSL